jgi:hypothetical protein
MGGAVERRVAGRRVPQAGEPLARVRLRTGRDLEVCDVSDGGVLVDGQARLLPGTHVDVHVVSPTGRVLVRCRVVRSVVSRLDGVGVCYRSALAFQQPVDTRTAGYGLPEAIGEGPTPEGSRYPAAAPQTAPPHEQGLST